MKLYMKYIGLMLLVAMVMFVSYSPAVLAAPGDTQLVAAPDNRQTYISAAPPVKPQNQANTGSILVDIAGAPTKKVNTTIIGYIITSYSNGYADKAAGLTNAANRYYGAFQVSGNANTYANFIKNAQNAHLAESRALQIKAGGKLLSGASLIYSISKYNDPSKHKHSSLAFIEQTLRGIGIGVSGADLVGYKPAKPVSIVVGITKDAFAGETFSNMANKWDNPVINGMDSIIDAVNAEAYQDILFWYEYFNGTNDANVYGRPPRGIGVYKPNIYLYPDDDTLVKVVFDAPGLLTRSIPDYSGSWLVKASPEGSLNSLSNNAKYDYLFYESEADTSLFTCEKGWIVKAASRDEQFRSILSGYGFNERETNDFIEFWTEKLDKDTDYIMYPQTTEIVDRVMPIKVSPEPDNSFRLWFAFETAGSCFKANDTGAAPELPVVTPIDRTGYSLVEWGGLILDEAGN